MKKLLICLLPFLALPVMAQNGVINGLCAQGGTMATTSGLNSSNYLQGIVPSCTITVYLTGTTTLATIYSTSTGTPLSNPFTANATGSENPGGWVFWASPLNSYDIVASGGISPNNYPQPITLCAGCSTSLSSGGVITGNLIVNGAFSATSTNNTQHCEEFPGATADIQISNCLAALPSGGIADLTGYGTTTQTLANASAITIPTNITVKCSPATIFNITATQGDIFLPQPTSIMDGCTFQIPENFTGNVYHVLGTTFAQNLALQNGVIKGVTITPIPIVLSAVAGASGGTTTYTGTNIPTTNLSGSIFSISGFTNSANNGTFAYSSSTPTSLTVSNSSGVAESNTGKAVNVEGGTATYTMTLSAASAVSNTIYATYTGTGIPTSGLNGALINISGFSNSGNNGTFEYVSSTATTLTVMNGSSVAEAHAGSASTTLTGTAFLLDANDAYPALVGSVVRDYRITGVNGVIFHSTGGHFHPFVNTNFIGPGWQTGGPFMTDFECTGGGGADAARNDIKSVGYEGEGSTASSNGAIYFGAIAGACIGETFRGVNVWDVGNPGVNFNSSTGNVYIGSSDGSIVETVSSVTDTYPYLLENTVIANNNRNLNSPFMTGTVISAHGPQSATGAVTLNGGDASHTGFLAWFNPAGTRTGFFGNDTGSFVTLNLNTGYGFSVSGGNGIYSGATQAIDAANNHYATSFNAPAYATHMWHTGNSAAYLTNFFGNGTEAPADELSFGLNFNERAYSVPVSTESTAVINLREQGSAIPGTINMLTGTTGAIPSKGITITPTSTTINNSTVISVESSFSGYAACYTTSGALGHCTTVVSASGTCTCTQ